MYVFKKCLLCYRSNSNAANANYALGFVQLAASIVFILASEVASTRSRLNDDTVIWVQRFTGDLAVAGAFVEAAMLFLNGELEGVYIDGFMMMIMFTILSITYYTMAYDCHIVHESPIAKYFGAERPVYTWRYIEWILCTPILTISGSRGAKAKYKKSSGHAIYELDLLASAFNIPMCCLAAWTGSVIQDEVLALILIVLSYISHIVACWEILPFAWSIRKSYMGGVKAFMLQAFMVINTFYGLAFALGIFHLISPVAEQIFFTVGDISAKYVWSISLMVVKDKSLRELIRVERSNAAEEATRSHVLAKKTMDAVASVEELTSPLKLVPATMFMQIDADKIDELQETYKKLGTLRILETMSDVVALRTEGARIIFFSYECLRWSRVAPNTIQLDCMKESVREILTNQQWKLENIFIWLDCFSIPQSNPFLQRAAIGAIYVFASIPDLMVIVCPETIHESTNLPANSESLKKRFWCRIEQFAYYCQNGSSRMLLKRDEFLEELPTHWVESVCCVFDGESTCCRLAHPAMACDRKENISPLLALYFDLYWLNEVEHTKDPVKESAWELIQAHKDRIFPKTFMYKCQGGEEELELFGDAIERMEHLVSIGQLSKEIAVDGSRIDRRRSCTLRPARKRLHATILDCFRCRRTWREERCRRGREVSQMQEREADEGEGP